MNNSSLSIEDAGLDELNELKKWLFSENIRLKTALKEVEEERALINVQKGILQKQQRKNQIYKTQLDNQRMLFESQWDIMENEIRRLTAEKQQFERDKAVYRDEIYREARKEAVISTGGRVFFKGIKDGNTLRKRYRDLMKIFHPDNPGGDSTTIHAITAEYERLKSFYFE